MADVKWPYFSNLSNGLADRHHIAFTILRNKIVNIMKTKLESIFLIYSCKSHRFETANIKILSTNSKHR